MRASWWDKLFWFLLALQEAPSSSPGGNPHFWTPPFPSLETIKEARELGLNEVHDTLCVLSYMLQIAQYINLQMPVLEAIIRKFNEEEERELQKIKQRYVETTGIHLRSQNLRHRDPCMGLNWGVSGFCWSYR